MEAGTITPRQPSPTLAAPFSINPNASDAVYYFRRNAPNIFKNVAPFLAFFFLLSAAVAPIEIIGQRGTPIGQAINAVKLAVFYRS